MGMSGNGGFLGGLSSGMGGMQQFMAQKQLSELFQNLQQGQIGRMADPTFAANPSQIQGPVAPAGGVSLRNRMLSGMRGLL